MGFTGSYSSIKRYLRRLNTSTPLPFRRMECDPGIEAQIDFGKGAFIQEKGGRRHRPHVLRITLSHSRKGYSEAVPRQTTDLFIRCLENAFWYFGGVPATLVIDNLRAAVTRADWYDPDLNPKIQSFAEHYGTVILPTKSNTPRHKGKIESGVSYVRDNGLKGWTFASFEEHNRFLLHWEENVADTRIHGTTRRQVGKVFGEVEHPKLLPLPKERFPFFHECERKVHRDGHVEVDKAYYSVSPEYLGQQPAGPMGCPARAYLYRPAHRLPEAGRGTRKKRDGALQRGSQAHRLREDLLRGTRRYLAFAKGMAHRPAEHYQGGSYAGSEGDPRCPCTGRAAQSFQKILCRSNQPCQRHRPYPRCLQAAGDSGNSKEEVTSTGRIQFYGAPSHYP
ncbi:MAG: IS21 family transposase [Planctomycetota bacterium]